ncbi:MAG: trigger factor [Anaerolineae bacterium]
MRVTTERLDQCQVNVIIEMDAAEVDEKLRQTAQKIAKQFPVPGYRRGRAPFHAVVRAFGREAIRQQALEEFGEELYQKALQEIDYKPYQSGELKAVEWDPFRMTILLPIQPEVELGDYRAVRVPLEPEPVTEEQVEQKLKEFQEQHTQWVPVERPAAMGDQVVLDLKAEAEGESLFDQESQELLLTAGSDEPLLGFHEAVVGMSAGEEKTFSLPLPEDEPRRKAGAQEATLRVRLHTVKEANVPPLDDDLAMMVGDYDSLEALKAGIRQELEAQALARAEDEYLDKVLEAMIASAVKVEYPPQAVEDEIDLMINQTKNNLASIGIELNRYLALIGTTQQAYRQELRSRAEARLRQRLVLYRIAELEKLQVEDAEVENEIERMSKIVQVKDDKFSQLLNSPAGRLMISEDLLLERARRRVIQIAKGEAPALEEGTEEAGDKSEPSAELTDQPPMDEISEAVVTETTGSEEFRPQASCPVEPEQLAGRDLTDG